MLAEALESSCICYKARPAFNLRINDTSERGFNSICQNLIKQESLKQAEINYSEILTPIENVLERGYIY